MEDNGKEERSFELRSEKVRSIVGQMPSSLLRYGITVIGFVLLCLFLVGYFLPYKQIYSGEAALYGVKAAALADSTDFAILLRFENKRPGNIKGLPIVLQPSGKAYTGSILSLSPVRDTLNRQEAICRFKSLEAESMENQTVDFQIVVSSGNMLQNLLGGL